MLVEPGSVLVRPDVAAVLGPLLRRAMGQAVRVDGLRFPADVWQAVDEMEASGRAFRAGALDSPLARARGAEGPGCIVDDVDGLVIGLSRAAQLLGCSRQAVADRCRRGTLPFDRDGEGRYVFDRRNLETA